MNHEHDPTSTVDEKFPPQDQTEICRACGSVVLRASHVDVAESGYESDLSSRMVGYEMLETAEAAIRKEEYARFKKAAESIDVDGHTEAEMVVRLLAAAERNSSKLATAKVRRSHPIH
jgi:hypothetical protein